MCHLGQLCVNYYYYDEIDTLPTCAKEAADYNCYDEKKKKKIIVIMAWYRRDYLMLRIL